MNKSREASQPLSESNTPQTELEKRRLAEELNGNSDNLSKPKGREDAGYSGEYD